MLIKLLIPLILVFLSSCVQKANIHEVLGKKTVVAQPILVKNGRIDIALQKLALRKLEEEVKSPPIDVRLKSKVFKRGVIVLVGKGKLEDIGDYDYLSEKYGNVDVLVVMEIKGRKLSERRYVSNVEDEFGTKYYCVEREARAVVLFNVINPKSEEVFFAKTYKGLDYKRYCDEAGYKPQKLPDMEVIFLKAIERTIGAFVRDFYAIL